MELEQQHRTRVCSPRPRELIRKSIGDRMSKKFISYTRQSGALARNLVKDIQSLNPIVWFDLSYLDAPARKIDVASSVSYEEQGALVLDFEQSLPDHEATDDTGDSTGDQLEMRLERVGTASKPAIKFFSASAMACRSSIRHFAGACAP